MSSREEIILKNILGLLCGQISYREVVIHIGQTKTPYIGTLNAPSYSERFALLLDLEELQLQHQLCNLVALSLVSKHQAFSILFPEQSEPDPAPNTSTLSPWVNPLIEQNPEQKLAIKQVVNKTSGDSPNLLFGPPGTGKTVTIVEAIAQQAGYLVTGGAEGMFKFVYIDECGQASEPESLVAIAGLITTRKRHISG
ncbi:Helicase MOV-10 [Homalodisca vitripennis]|nr:Helicase MOV-10 [Homalodisca vitripennis]